MTFYGERFRRPDEEDIWEELKQMLLNPPSEQEIALKKQQEQAWIDSILNKAFPENPNAQTEQTLKTNNSSISPMGTLNQNTLEGFGQNSINGFTNKKKQSEFPDLGKAIDYKNESFAPVYNDEEKEMRKNYFRDPNQDIVIDEKWDPLAKKKKKPKYEAEEPVDYEEMPDEEEDTTSEELETSEETEEGNSKEEPEETSSEFQDEPYLRYEDLLPDESDEEREAREARELEAFNKAWDKANGVNTESASPKDSKGKLTGKATPVLEGKVVYEKEPSIYEKIDSREDWSDELKAQKKAEVAKIQQAYEARNKEIDREYTLGQLKDYAGAALEIGSAFVPGYGGAKLATTGSRYLGKKLAPIVGRKFAKQIEKSTAQGAIMGSLEGAVRGSLEDESVAKTIAQDTLIGALGGATLGTVLGRNAHIKRKKNLDELLDKRKDWGIAFTKQSGKPAEAIDKLLEQKQGFVPKATKKRGIGDIDFVWGDSGKGLRHVIERRNAEGIDGQQFVKELPNFLKNSKVYKKKEHIDRKYIGDNHKEASIKADYNKKPRNWLVSSYNLKEEAPLQDLPGGRALEQTYASGQQISPPDLTKVPHNIITNSNSNLNPSQQSIQKPLSHNEWLEELKCRRKKGRW